MSWTFVRNALANVPVLIQQATVVLPRLVGSGQPIVERWALRVIDATLDARSTPFVDGTLIAAQAFVSGTKLVIPHRLGTANVAGIWGIPTAGTPAGTIAADANNVTITPTANFTASLWLIPVPVSGA